MKQYKLIKSYPGSPRIGTIATEESPYYRYNGCCMVFMHIIEGSPEYWELVVEKDYEIMSYKYCDKIYKYTTAPSLIGSIGARHYEYDGGTIDEDTMKFLSISPTIYSVKRLSDGEIFAIGDKIKEFFVLGDGLKYNTIQSFRIGEVGCVIANVSKNCGLSISLAKKYKERIFTTEDDREMFEGDKYYAVYSTWYYDTFSVSKNSPLNHAKTFSSIELAEKYIQENKPQYSKKDMIAFASEMMEKCESIKYDKFTTIQVFKSNILSILDSWIKLNKK